MAETVRPESADTLSKLVSGQLNFNRFSRGLNSLRRLNLIVVKRQENAPDLLELHPLVRQFVRTNFPKRERVRYITLVVKSYDNFISLYRNLLEGSPPLSVLENWSQKAEVEIEAGLHKQAFETLNEVKIELVSGGYSEEYQRVSKMLFESVDWIEASTSIPRKALRQSHDLTKYPDDVARFVEFTKASQIWEWCTVLLLMIFSIQDRLAAVKRQYLRKRTQDLFFIARVRCYCYWIRVHRVFANTKRQSSGGESCSVVI